MSNATNTRVSKDIGHGISMLGFEAEVLVNPRYTLDEHHLGSLVNYASTHKLPDDNTLPDEDKPTLDMTWNGHEKPFSGVFPMTLPGGSKKYHTSTEYTPSHSFYVKDPDNPDATVRRAATSFGYTKVNETEYTADFAVVTEGFAIHPDTVINGAPVTNYPARP